MQDRAAHVEPHQQLALPAGRAARTARGARMRSRQVALVVTAVVITTAVAAGSAVAYFNTSGAGVGSASAAQLQTVTVSAFVGGDAPTSALYPGGPSADVVLRVSNPNG